MAYHISFYANPITKPFFPLPTKINSPQSQQPLRTPKQPPSSASQTKSSRNFYYNPNQPSVLFTDLAHNETPEYSRLAVVLFNPFPKSLRLDIQAFRNHDTKESSTLHSQRIRQLSSRDTASTIPFFFSLFAKHSA